MTNVRSGKLFDFTPLHSNTGDVKLEVCNSRDMCSKSSACHNRVKSVTHIYLIVPCLQIKAVVFYTTRKRYKVLFVCCQQMRFEAKICFSSGKLSSQRDDSAVELSILIIITKEELVNVPFSFAIPLNKQRLCLCLYLKLCLVFRNNYHPVFNAGVQNKLYL